MNGCPTKYSLSHANLIAQDVEKRNYFYRKAVALLDRKAELDLNYANLLEQVINKDFVKSTNRQVPSQHLYCKLVSIILEEPKRIRKMAQDIKEKSAYMNSIIEADTTEVKKSLDSIHKASKDIQSQRERLQKSKNKYDKKNEELQYSKIKYLSYLIGTEQLQKVNDLYLEVNSLEDSVKPLLEDYRSLFSRFQESVTRMVEQFSTTLQRIEEIQSKKIVIIKDSVSKYVRLSKQSLDEVMQNYPFICEQIDRVRQKEELLFQNYALGHEGQLTGALTLRQSDYIDSIYDRIEKKKNIEDIILYGQNNEHKKNLSASFIDNGGSSQVIELAPKTLRMIDIFKAVFQGQSSAEMIKELKGLFEGDQKLRKDFILCLQQFRINSEFQLNLKSKQCISECLLAFLDVCHSELDTYNSKMLMVLSLTYHFKEETGKVELQQLIRDHHIWNKNDWWQAALIETIYEEVRIKATFKEVPVRIWDIKAGGICRKEEGEEVTYQYICFNQLLFFVSNMSLFNLSSDQIVQYAKFNIHLLKFTGKLAKDILDLCPQNASPSLKKKQMSSP